MCASFRFAPFRCGCSLESLYAHQRAAGHQSPEEGSKRVIFARSFIYWLVFVFLCDMFVFYNLFRFVSFWCVLWLTPESQEVRELVCGIDPIDGKVPRES